MRTLNVIAVALLIVGGLNWGLVGLFEFDLVAALLGGSTAVPAKLVYVLVGAAAVQQAVARGGMLRRVATA